MTSFGFVSTILGFITLHFSEDSRAEWISASVMLIGLLSLSMGITIKLWEVMP